MTYGFSPHLGTHRPALSTTRALGAWPRVPNTLPPQDWNRDAELGRVGSSLCRASQLRHKRLNQSARHPGMKIPGREPASKTCFYNMLGTGGQTRQAGEKQLARASKAERERPPGRPYFSLTNNKTKIAHTPTVTGNSASCASRNAPPRGSAKVSANINRAVSIPRTNFVFQFMWLSPPTASWEPAVIVFAGKYTLGAASFAQDCKGRTAFATRSCRATTLGDHGFGRRNRLPDMALRMIRHVDQQTSQCAG